MGGRGGGGEGRGGRGADPLVLVVSVANLMVEDVVKNIGEERANVRRAEGRVLCEALLCPRTPANPLRLRRGMAVCQSGGAWQGVADAWVSGGACGRGAAHTWFPTGTAVTAGVVPVTTGGTAGGAAEFELERRFPMLLGVLVSAYLTWIIRDRRRKAPLTIDIDD